MHPIQKHLFDTNFQDLAGTRIEGTISLSEELINLGVADFLNGLMASAQSTPASAPTEAPATERMPDPKAMLQLLKVDKLEVRLEQGQMKVDVKAGI